MGSEECGGLTDVSTKENGKVECNMDRENTRVRMGCGRKVDGKGARDSNEMMHMP